MRSASLIALTLIAALTTAVPVSRAQESASLATPILATAGISVLRPSLVTFDIERGVIHVELKEWVSGAFVNDGRAVWVRYDATGSLSSRGTKTVAVDAGRALIIALNKANLSTTSLEKRILNRLIADGHLTGTVSGAPQ